MFSFHEPLRETTGCRTPVVSDHTNLHELRVEWHTGTESGVLRGPHVQPHSSGVLSLPARAWNNNHTLSLKFYRLGDLLVDEYNLPLAPAKRELAGPQGPAPKLTESDDSIVVTGSGFSLTFSKQTGLITRGEYKGQNIVESGPYLQLTGGRPLPGWSLKHMNAAVEGNEAVLTISGGYGETMVTFILRIDGAGLLQTTYTLNALPELDRKLVRGHSFSRDVGGYFEVGVAYVLTPEVDRFSWARKGLWSAYPSDHIGRNFGTAKRFGKDASSTYRDAPQWPWAEDEKDFLLFGKYDVGGRGTNDFRSTKENIYFASAILQDSSYRVQAQSTGTEAARLEIIDDPRSLVTPGSDALKLTGTWDRVKVGLRSAHPGDSAELKVYRDRHLLDRSHGSVRRDCRRVYRREARSIGP